MNKILPLIVSVVFCSGVNSQSIQRQSIGTLGSTHHGEEISLQQSVGQPYQTNTYYSNEIESRPGFIQPSRFSLELVNSTFQIEVTVYPNPATAEVSFMTNENVENLTIQVFDQTGKILFTDYVDLLHDYKLNCSEWESGLYFIYLRDLSDNVYQSKLIKN